MNLEDGSGHILLVPQEVYSQVQIPLYSDNDLCYHCQSHTVRTQDSASERTINGNPTVNRLLDAAKWELWHQRLVHPGSRVMEQQHKHADGISALRGNAFYRCPSCMPNKLCTKGPGKHKNLGASSQKNEQEPQRSDDQGPTAASEDKLANHDSNGEKLTEEEQEWEDYLDELHLPDALPRQHFHIDFRFVQGSDFKVPTK